MRRRAGMSWARDGRAWALFGLLVVIALLDLAFPEVAYLTFLAVPAVASIALGRASVTLLLVAAALVIFVALSLGHVEDSVLVWRRGAVLVATGVLSIVMAWVVQRANRRLERQAREYQLIAENSSDVVFRGSNEGVLEWISATSGSVNWAPERMIGRPFVEFVHPDDVATVRATQQGLLAGRPGAMQVRIQAGDGSYRWVSITVKPTVDDSGRITSRVGGWVDIEDLVQARTDAENRRAATLSIFDSQLDPHMEFSPVRDASGRIVDLRIEEANPAAFEYNRSTPEKMLGATFLELFPGLMEHGPMRGYLDCAEYGTPLVLDDYAYDNEILGMERRYDIRAVRTDFGVSLTWRDVTDRYRAVEQLADSERRYRLLAENGTDVIWQLGPDGVIEWSSESTLPVLGWTVESVVGRRPFDFVHADDRAESEAQPSRALSGGDLRDECRIRRADGSFIWMSIRVTDIGPRPTRVVLLRDIDAEVEARDQLSRVVGRDPLTGLMTREVMRRRIESAVAQEGKGAVTLLCVGLDSLSEMNEAFTHAVGDVVLATTAARIVEEVGDPDRVARGTGVDFIVLCEGDADVADAAALAERIRSASSEVVLVGDHRINPTVSIGVASAADADDPEQLVRDATLAMRNAKAAGRDRVAFAVPVLAEDALRRMTLAAEIGEGLRMGEFTGWYQPVHDLSSGALQGYEALARWIRPDGTVVEPAVFMPITERSPMVLQLDLAVLTSTLSLMATLPEPQFVAVNVSARSLASAEYADGLLSGIRETGIDPSRLHMEITETALLDVSDDVIERMLELAHVGIKWYVDDFGTGFSSISHLRDLPVSGLKLDISFSAGVLAGDTRSIQLALALAGLARGLGLDTVAEGVSTRELSDVLAAQGWRRGQGWFYGKAVPREQLAAS